MRPVYEIATAEGAELRQCGNTFRGLCLLHDHDGCNPSFACGEGWFKCFSCGASGDGITFVMRLKKMTFPQALAYLGEELRRPTPQQRAQLAKERRERAAARWNEIELARTLGIAIRLCHEAIERITPDTLDDFALFLDQLPILEYQHDIMIYGDQAARAELVRDMAGLRLFKRNLLFRKNFDFRAWVRRVNTIQSVPVEVVKEPQPDECNRIKIFFE